MAGGSSIPDVPELIFRTITCQGYYRSRGKHALADSPLQVRCALVLLYRGQMVAGINIVDYEGISPCYL